MLKYRVPHGSQPRHGWVPDPPMVGIRSPIGLVVGSCTSHPGVLGLIPKREEPGKTGAPCVKVQGSSRVPQSRTGGCQSSSVEGQPQCPGLCHSSNPNARSLSHSPSAPPPSFTQSPYPPRSLMRDEQTHPHRPQLVVSHSTCPPLSSPPHANSFVIGSALIKPTHTHQNSEKCASRRGIPGHQAQHPRSPEPDWIGERGTEEEITNNTTGTSNL